LPRKRYALSVIGLTASLYFEGSHSLRQVVWGELGGDVVVVTPLLDRLMHHGHLLKFEGKSWRLKEAAARVVRKSAQS
jgi:hypothetical protein